MRHVTLFTLVTLTACLFGCSQDEILSRSEDDTRQIVFTPMEFGEAVAATRGTQISKSNITSYGVSASICPTGNSYTSVGCGSYWFNEEIDAETGKSGYYWPGVEKDVSFFAYAPYGATGLSLGSRNDLGYPRYTYTIPSAITSQSDFITADVVNHSGAGITDPVPLTFSHRCADLRFSVYNQGSSSITVHSIGVYGVKYSGTYCESTSPKWTLTASTNSTSSNPFLLSLGTTVAAGATVDMTGTTNHFIMLPQTVASGTQIYDVDATVNGTRKHYYHNLPAAFEMLAGKVYTVTLTLGESSMIVDTDTDIQDWAVEVKYLSVSGISCPSNTYTQPTVTDGEVLGVDSWEKVPRYFQFKAVNAGTFQFSKAGLSYSTDMGQTWTALAANTATPSIAANSYIFWKSNTAMTPTESEGIGTFSATGAFDAYGNIMSLLYGDNGDEQTSLSAYSYAFTNLFKDNTYLRKGRYMSMPATTLSEKCYNGMFKGCTNMTNAPELPATTLATGCYNEIFKGCSSLKYIKALFLTTPSDTYTADWVNGVASDGTFVKNSSASWNVTGNNGIPSSWTVETE